MPKARELVAEPNRPQLAAAAPTPAQAEWQEPDVEIQAWRQLYLNQNGLELRQPLRVGEHRFELGLKGPLMKRKRVGLAFELRF